MRSLIRKKEGARSQEAQCCAKQSKTAVGCHD
jgi:hypothetical protein